MKDHRSSRVRIRRLAEAVVQATFPKRLETRETLAQGLRTSDPGTGPKVRDLRPISNASRRGTILPMQQASVVPKKEHGNASGQGRVGQLRTVFSRNARGKQHQLHSTRKAPARLSWRSSGGDAAC